LLTDSLRLSSASRLWLELKVEVERVVVEQVLRRGSDNKEEEWLRGMERGEDGRLGGVVGTTSSRS